MQSSLIKRFAIYNFNKYINENIIKQKRNIFILILNDSVPFTT